MIWFTSDHHFGHANVIKYCNRPFKSVEEMDAVMLSRWNEVVHPSDLVYYLGDFSLGKRQVREFLPKLNGTKVFVSGNHDWCHPLHSKGNFIRQQKAKNLYRDCGVSFFHLIHDIEINGKTVVLCHFPYKNGGDHTETERYPEYRPENNGHWLLHGHVHQHWLVKDKQINIGVDRWDFYPVHESEIQKLIK